MKLFSLRLMTLKSKLYAIVFASIVVRVVAFFTLPNMGSTLAPDEGSYAALSLMVSENEFKLQPSYYGGLYKASRTLVLPASLLNNFGVDPINSVRIISSVYGLLTLIILVRMLTDAMKRNPSYETYLTGKKNYVLALVLIFAFLPSHFLWSTLALRESATEFWVVCFYLIFHKVTKISKRLTLVTSTLLILTTVMVFNSRPQVGIILSLAIFIYFAFKLKQRITYQIIPIVLFAILFGYASTASTAPTASTASTAPTAPTAPTAETPETILETILYQSENIQKHQELNQLYAASAIKTVNCPVEGESKLAKYFCLVWRAPYSTSTFLLRPFIVIDITSRLSLFGAIENIFWLSAFLYILVLFTRNRRLAFFGALAPSLLFFSIYSVAAGAYEGNMGTAFRHKSLILWVVLLLIASTIVATQQRKVEQQGISGSSQE